jgi:hypothetical protein
VPVESVTGDVTVVAPVNDVTEPLPPDALTAAAALVIAPGVFVDTLDPVTSSDVVMFVEPGDVVSEELPDPGEDVLLLGVDMLELIDDERDDVGAVCVNSSEIPLLPSTDPVWTLAIGLQGVEVALVRPRFWLGGVSEVGFGGTCATAVDAHAMLIQMNRGSFISNLLCVPLCDSPEIRVQAASHTTGCARLKGSRYRLSESSPMTTTARPRQHYDHRLRALVQHAWHVTLATGLMAPISLNDENSARNSSPWRQLRELDNVSSVVAGERHEFKVFAGYRQATTSWHRRMVGPRRRRGRRRRRSR